MKIYVATSWKNDLQPTIVELLRHFGHEVYDFRNPSEGNYGFSWSEVDPQWRDWTPAQWREGLKHPVAQQGYKYDITALRWCDACLMVMPAGRSASWELGYAMGQGKQGFVYDIRVEIEPELMFLEAEILTDTNELIKRFGGRI